MEIQNLIIMEKEIEKIPLDEAMEMLKEVGINVNQEDAELIMEFLYNLVGIIIRECFAEYMD
jgi:hypothetical protein